MSLRPVFLFVLMAFGMAACIEQECNTLQREDQLTVAFTQRIFNTTTNQSEDRDSTVAVLQVYGMAGGITTDSLTQANGDTASFPSIRLPLAPQQDTAAFVWQFVGKTPADTLVLAYRRQPFYISQACGFEIRYSNLSIVRSTFANAAIAEPTTTLPNEFRIVIRLR